MKIGVLLMGQVRNFDVTTEFLKKEFDLPGVDVDYFCHTWDSVVNFSPWNNMKTTDERFSDLQMHDKGKLMDTINLINPKKYTIESYDKLEEIFDTIYHPEYKNETTNVVHDQFLGCGWAAFDSDSTLKFSDWNYYFSLLGQFYSTSRALDLLCEYEREVGIKYDIIVRWRYDLVSNTYYRDTDARVNQWCVDPMKHEHGDTIFFNSLSIWRGMQCATDHMWFGAAGAFKSYTSNFDQKYISLVRAKIMNNKTVLNENAVQDIIINQKMSSKESSMGLAVVRPGATKEMSFDELYDLEIAHEAQKRSLALRSQ